MKKVILCAFFLSLISSSAVYASLVPFFQPGTSSGTFTMNVGETRETLFQALQNVTLTQLAAEIDPGSSQIAVRWRIFNSNAGSSFGSTVFDSGVLNLIDLGMTTYATTLGAGISLSQNNFYILSLTHVSGGITMQRYNEGNQGLAFVTNDSQFLILDGHANQNGNGILPSFSVNTNTVVPPPAVPEPSSVFLLLAGVCLLGSRRAQKI